MNTSFFYMIIISFALISCKTLYTKEEALTEIEEINVRKVRDIDKFAQKYEYKILKNKSNNVILSFNKKHEICKIKLSYIGYVFSKGDTLDIIKESNLFGLKKSPHSNGKIILYKNGKRYGEYKDFGYSFQVSIKNGLLEILDTDTENSNTGKKYNIVTFLDGIPKELFIKNDNSEYGDIHELHLF